jgi:hypothetical protein
MQGITLFVFITERLIFSGKIPYSAQKEHNEKLETALSPFFQYKSLFYCVTFHAKQLIFKA